jgi:hypothetical protein
MFGNSCVPRVYPTPALAPSVKIASSRPRTLVLIGAPGSGKTEVLAALAAQGEQVLDLEHLAAHRGSAFGSVGARQPSHSQFQTEVHRAVAAVDPDLPLWIEQEGRFIGSVGVPTDLAQQWGASETIALEVPRERRLARLVETYSPLASQRSWQRPRPSHRAWEPSAARRCEDFCNAAHWRRPPRYCSPTTTPRTMRSGGSTEVRCGRRSTCARLAATAWPGPSGSTSLPPGLRSYPGPRPVMAAVKVSRPRGSAGTPRPLLCHVEPLLSAKRPQLCSTKASVLADFWLGTSGDRQDRALPAGIIVELVDELR